MKLRDGSGRLLDAEIEIEPTDAGADIVLHARFGGSGSERRQNVDYFGALELLLSRLAGMRATIMSVSVDSRVARKLPENERLLDLHFPIRLSAATDAHQLRLDMTRTQRSVARSPEAQPVGGNNHKRIRLVIDLRTSSTSSSGLVERLSAVDNGAPGLISLGNAYRRAEPDPSVSPAELSTYDPVERERALAGHAQVQNALADVVRSLGWEPRSPRRDEPDFDLAWSVPEVFVAEVKSLTGANEVAQMRLGLGQVLHYRHQLAAVHGGATAVLAVERQPPPGWVDLCASLEVILVWPRNWSALGTTTRVDDKGEAVL